MYKIVLGTEVTMPCQCEVGKEMGITTWAAFYGNAKTAVVDGDFACTALQLQGVLVALRLKDMQITAIHNHTVDETPRLMFVHYWGIGRVNDLAGAVKAAIDAQARHRIEQEPPK